MGVNKKIKGVRKGSIPRVRVIAVTIKPVKVIKKPKVSK
jgi:hypothetical protein